MFLLVQQYNPAGTHHHTQSSWFRGYIAASRAESFLGEAASIYHERCRRRMIDDSTRCLKLVENRTEWVSPLHLL